MLTLMSKSLPQDEEITGHMLEPKEHSEAWDGEAEEEGEILDP